MAEITQLKNENGTKIYPITTGEAILMDGGKTLDQAFIDKVSTLNETFESKATELNEKVDGIVDEYGNKAGYLTNSSPEPTSFPLGSILLASMPEPSLVSINEVMKPYLVVLGVATVMTVHDDFFNYYIGNKYNNKTLIPGKWVVRGQGLLDMEKGSGVLLQRIA